ncbi:MAG TPA: hypothetical protein VGM98_24370 [Schlesneria sp.]|jgi:Kef-type K+ transport system membrane component KefB
MPKLRDPAVSAAMLTIGVADIGLICLSVVMGITGGVPPTDVLISVLLALPVVAAMTLVAGFGIGWFANYWFRATKIPTDQVAIVVALIFDCLVGGWLMALVVIYF